MKRGVLVQWKAWSERARACRLGSAVLRSGYAKLLKSKYMRRLETAFSAAKRAREVAKSALESWYTGMLRKAWSSWRYFFELRIYRRQVLAKAKTFREYLPNASHRD